jgi:RNA polymerase sigma-70 factor (ECF subfamily)
MVATDSSGTPARSFSEIFLAEVRFLWRALRSLGIPEADTDDLCQEVMIVVHRRLDEFKGRSLRGWLYGICVRVASDYRRSAVVKRRSRDPVPEVAIQPAAEGQVEAKQLESRLLAALDELDYDKRVVFVLYELEELTLREISEALSVPLQTVYSRLHSARDHVRRTFAARSLERHRGGLTDAR